MKATGFQLMGATGQGVNMKFAFSRERVARGMALAGATMCVYFVDSRFQGGPSAGLMPGVAELFAVGLFLSGLFLCQSESKVGFPTSKVPSAPRKGTRPEREFRPSARPEDTLPRNTQRGTERGSANGGSSNGQSLTRWNQ